MKTEKFPDRNHSLPIAKMPTSWHRKTRACHNGLKSRRWTSKFGSWSNGWLAIRRFSAPDLPPESHHPISWGRKFASHQFPRTLQVTEKFEERGVLVLETHGSSRKAYECAIWDLEETQVNQDEVVSQHNLIPWRRRIGIQLPWRFCWKSITLYYWSFSFFWTCPLESLLTPFAFPHIVNGDENCRDKGEDGENDTSNQHKPSKKFEHPRTHRPRWTYLSWYFGRPKSRFRDHEHVCVWGTYGEDGSHARTQGYLREHKLKHQHTSASFHASNCVDELKVPNGQSGEPIRRNSSTLTSLSSQEKGLHNWLWCFSSTIARQEYTAM